VAYVRALADQGQSVDGAFGQLDAVRDGVITAPVRILAPGFGAGAVAGYTVLTSDPAVVAVQQPGAPDRSSTEPVLPASDGDSPASEEIRVAFG
jgi:hypothetical protein